MLNWAIELLPKYNLLIRLCDEHSVWQQKWHRLTYMNTVFWLHLTVGVHILKAKISNTHFETLYTIVKFRMDLFEPSYVPSNQNGSF